MKYIYFYFIRVRDSTNLGSLFFLVVIYFVGILLAMVLNSGHCKVDMCKLCQVFCCKPQNRLTKLKSKPHFTVTLEVTSHESNAFSVSASFAFS